MTTQFANLPSQFSMETIGSLGWIRVDDGALLFVLNAEGTWDRARELPKGDLPRGLVALVGLAFAVVLAVVLFLDGVL